MKPTNLSGIGTLMSVALSAFCHCDLQGADPLAAGLDRHDNHRDWAIYRGDKRASQYSELNQIHTGNIHQLEKVWEYRYGDPNGPAMYSNPIVVDGLMYFTTPRVNVVALDAATGEQVWVFESARYNAGKREFRGRNRGVVYWEDSRGNRKRIFNFVKDRVYAIDAKSGGLIESFGVDGHIDLRRNLPVDPATADIEVTTPGITFRNLLIVGSRSRRGMIRRRETSGPMTRKPGSSNGYFTPSRRRASSATTPGNGNRMSATEAPIPGAAFPWMKSAAGSSAPPGLRRAISFTEARAKG